jgi:AraC family transcriptional regulator
MIPIHHIIRITRVIEYIEENLGHHGSHEYLAGIAMFSKFHFSRIFKNVVGETFYEYVGRIKMEKAYRTIHLNPSISIKELSRQHGYKTPSIFHNRYEISPIEAKATKVKPIKRYIDKTFKPNILFEGICTLPHQFVLYKIIFSGYNSVTIQSTFRDLYEFAMQNNFEVKEFIGILHDDPVYTGFRKCRYVVCLAINKPERLLHDFNCNVKSLKKAEYACFFFEGKIEDIQPTWDYIFHHWVVTNGYVPLLRPRIEIFLLREEAELKSLRTKLYLPVKL